MRQIFFFTIELPLIVVLGLITAILILAAVPFGYIVRTLIVGFEIGVRCKEKFSDKIGIIP